MIHRGGLNCVLAMLYLLAAGAAASDIPFKDNLAAREARDIERGVFVLPETSKGHLRVKSIFAPLLRWQTGALKVCFWNGNAEMHSQIAAIADELVVGLPVSFRWRESGVIPICKGGLTEPHAPWRTYEVRVSLGAVPELLKDGDDPSAFFAQIGKQSRTGRRATVNLPFQPSHSTDDIRNLTLHEFCHVLGCLHEHQRSMCVNDFDENAIRSKFNLTPDQYRDNFLTIPSGHAYGATVQSVFDRHSVMLYRLTRDMFVQGSSSPCIVDKPATRLSDLDRAGLRAAYAAKSDGPRLKLEDFSRLEMEARFRASVQRNFADYLRKNSITDQTELQSLTSQARVREAEQLAIDAEDEAKSYVLTPEQTSAIRLALSYFEEE